MNLYVFDGTALIYRAFHALPPDLSTSDGRPTNAILGVTRMISKFMKERLKAKDTLIFVMDTKAQNFRQTLFEDYKANRIPAPEEMIVQIPYVEKLIEALKIPLLKGIGYEADDVIATIIKKYVQKFDMAYIVTGDKDLLQLVGGNVRVLRFGSIGVSDLVEYDEKSVVARYGLTPSQMGDYLSLVGDESDNIPGVKGIGEKSATELLQKYGTVQNIYAHLDELPSRQANLLKNGIDSMKMSKELVTLFEEVPISVDLKSYEGYDREKLVKLFDELEFISLKSEFGLYDKTDSREKNYSNVKSIDELERIARDLQKTHIFSFDTETTSLDPFSAKLVGISLSNEERSFYIPVGHKVGSNLPIDRVIAILKPIFEDKNNRIVGQNLKYDLEVMKNYGVDINAGFDTMIAAYLVDPNGRKFSLEELALKYLNYKGISYEAITGGKNFEEVSIEEATRYSSEDSDLAYRLYPILNKHLYEKDLINLFNKIEMPLVGVLARMETNGVYVDEKILSKLSEEYELKLHDIEKQIYDTSGGMPFNINSPKQLSEVLFQRLGLKPGKKTSTKAFSTSADVLEDMVDEHPIIPLILEYRKYFKLKSTYIDALPKMINSKTGRVHTSFNQTGTSTGRLSSSEPNLQNIPARNEEGLEIRKAIKAQKDGWKIISFDYSQIELRVLAHVSEDEALIDAFKEGMDVHSITASKIYGVSPEDVTQDMRRIGKMVNFAVTYGVSAYGLSKRVGISVESANEVITNYFKNYPKVRQYLENTLDFARKNGYVETIAGRKRDIPEMKSVNHNTVEEGKRMAINAPIQGSAADIIKKAMIEIDEKLSNMKTMMILQVHDELVFEVPPDEAGKAKGMIKESMEGIEKLKVPLEVEIEEGESW